MVSKPQLFFACPHCGADDQHSVTHFLSDKTTHSFGPWQCDAWFTAYGIQPRSPYLLPASKSSRSRLRDISCFASLHRKLKPIWFVVENDIHTRDGLRSLAEEMESKRYWVDEHTCPTNIVPVEAIIEGHGPSYDDDPHGVLQFAAWAPRPSDLPDGEDPDWCILFPQLTTKIILITHYLQPSSHGMKQEHVAVSASLNDGAQHGAISQRGSASPSLRFVTEQRISAGRR